MTNYTKTTDFAAKDALPSGNSAKIVKGSEIDTEFNNIATASATKANANAAALTGTTTFETISDGTIAITAFVDEDNMASDSATLLPTQQSVKAYVDSQVTAQDLDVTDGSTSIDIDLDSESLGILGGTGIDSTASGTGVTLAIDSTVATLTGSQTLSNKTLSAPVVSGNLTTDGLLDGRDVAADGTKLDGIEASADVTDTANVTAAGALMDSELTSEASVKALNQGVATTDSPTFAGLTTTADVSFGDNDKAIFGAGSDLQLYHDGANNYIEGSTGSIIIQNTNDDYNVIIKSDNGSGGMADYFRAKGDTGSALMYHYGNQKLATTSTGIDVTGTATMDELTVDSTTGFSWLPVSTAGAKVGVIGTGTGLIINTPSVNASYGSGLAIDGSYASSLSSVNIKAFGAKYGSYGSELNLFTSDDTSLLKRQTIASNGDISFYEDTGTTPKLFWDASAESLGIGTSSPNASADLHVADTSDARIWLEATSGDTMELYAGTNVSLFNRSNNALTFGTNNTERMRILSGGNITIGTVDAYFYSNASSGGTTIDAGFKLESSNQALEFWTADTERMRIDSSGNVGIGVTPESWNTYKTLQIGNGAIANYTPTHDMRMVSNAYYNSGWKYAESDGACLYLQDGNNSQHIWSVAASGTADAALTWSEAMRIDSSRNLLVGKTSSSVSGSGLTVIANDFMSYTNTSTDSGDRCLILNRQNGSGNILDFQQANGLVGSIGTANSGDLYIGNDDTSLLFAGGSDAILPRGTAGATRDAAIDLGLSAHRFKDLYRSGSTYSTSDRTMKQDIRDLTDAERNVAVACKGLLKAFRFIDAVEKDGDDANIHFGVIAQELAEAFEAEGLDANDYQVYKSAVITDDEGNEQTRLNVCYENLLAFIIAAI